MSLLSVVQDVCAVVGVARPTSVIAQLNSNRTMFEMLALANEMARRIAHETREWTKLTKMATLRGVTVPFGTPAPEGIVLPFDYQRMLLASNVWRSGNTQTPLRFIPDPEEWLYRKNSNTYAPVGEWMLQGGQMLIRPPLLGDRYLIDPTSLLEWANDHDYYKGDKARDAADDSLWEAVPDYHRSASLGTFADDRAGNPGRWKSLLAPAETVQFNYLDRLCVALASGGFNDAFVDDFDTYRLNERILVLGMIWQWKANKGSPYAEDMANYADALSFSEGSDKPAPTYIGRTPVSANAQVAVPWGPGWGPQ